MVWVSHIELHQQILTLANDDLLLSPTTSDDDLIPLLKQVECCLLQVLSSEKEFVLHAVAQLADELVSNFLERSNDDVKVAVAFCLSVIAQIFAPDLPPYDEKMKEAFKLIVSSFENLHDLSNKSLYDKRVSILKIVTDVRLCRVMMDSECDDLIVEMFQHFFKAVREFHETTKVSSYMLEVMNLVLEESEDVSTELLTSLLASFKKDNKVSPIAKSLGKRVLTESAAKLRPSLLRAIDSLNVSLDEYDPVVTELCNGTFPAVDDGDASVQEDPLNMSIQYEGNLGHSSAISGDGETQSNDSDNESESYSSGIWTRKRKRSSKVGGDEGRQQNSFDQEVSRKQLVSAIILHEYPLSIVDHVGLRNFVGSLQPLFKMVSRDMVKNDIMKTFDNLKSRTCKLLEKVTNRVVITTDMWTSDNKKEFMVITGHFIDGSWKRQSHILRFVYVPAPHGKDVLARVLLDCLSEWNLERKMSVTVDNSSTNNAMIKLLQDKQFSMMDFLMGKLFHVRCTTHILNLIVLDGIFVISEDIRKVRESVLYWIESLERIERFEEAARLIGWSCKLSYDCPTCWNSTYLMLRTALGYKEVFKKLSLDDRNYQCLPNEQQWTDAGIVFNKLEILHHISKQFSETNNPTLSLYFSKVCEIRLELDCWAEDTNPLITSMASAMLENFKKYLNEVHILMGVAAVFDPRYKMRFVEYSFLQVYGEEHLTKSQEVRTYCYDLFQDYKSRFPHVLSSKASSSLSGGDRLSSFDMFVASSCINTKSEMDMYLEEKLHDRTPSFDNLSWWEAHGSRYPILCRMAHDLLAIPVPSVASESAFSTSRRLVSPHCRLPLTELEALMCTRMWLSNEINGLTSTVDSVPCPTLLDDEKKPDLYN